MIDFLFYFSLSNFSYFSEWLSNNNFFCKFIPQSKKYEIFSNDDALHQFFGSIRTKEKSRTPSSG
jgi:hypothetical protein